MADMKVPLTIRDHLDRALAVYPDRVAFVDEPDQPAPSMGEVTFSRLGELADAAGAGLDALGVPMGGRVAMVSHNAGRLLTCFWGVSGNGRILVPVNFRLSTDELAYIVEHCGADVLLVDPELADTLASIDCRHKFVLGAESDEAIFRFGTDSRPWTPDEEETAVINYTSGTTARPKGVQQTHRSLWLNAAVFGWQTTVSDRDNYLHTLPMFHCNGWGMPYALVGMGAKQVVLRKVDGAEILRRVDEHGITIMCGAPAVVAAILAAAADWDGAIPGAGRTRIVVAGAPPPTRIIERVETELDWEFIQIYGLTETAPLLTMNRRRAEWDDLSPGERARKLASQGVPGLGVRMAVSPDGEFLARSNHVLEGYWEQPDATAAAIVDGWFHTGDGGYSDDDGYYTITDRKKTSSSPGARTCRPSRWRTLCSLIRPWPKWLLSGFPTPSGAKRSKRWWCWPPAPRWRPRISSPTAGASSPTTSAPPRWRSAPNWPAPPPASSRSSSCALPTGRAWRRPSTSCPIKPS